MSIDPVSPAPARTNLPVTVSPPSNALQRPHICLPVRNTCRIVNRMTGEIAGLVAERTLHRRDRRRTLWHIRQIAMYVCHVALQIPIADIADAFGRDRSTVAYSLRIVEDRRDDKAYDSFVDAVERLATSVFLFGEACFDE